jgi:hypothetical protein
MADFFAPVMVLAVSNFIIFSSVILLALFGNAILCGGLSSSEARYKSRLISLVPLTATVGFLRAWPLRNPFKPTL